ncbi:MAG TPA: phospholipase D-like domain-containing protein [Gemmatimonadales bacterium]|nr:phospholipase D-like domain-containing protein [Gemmatimonadales bacterium]
MSVPAARAPGAAASALPARAAERDQLALAIDRAAGARPIGGNRLEHYPDSPGALDAMLAQIAAARRWVHFENYIIRDDRTGRRFADALAERARAGVPVRVLYDALGSFGTSRRYWRRLAQAGVEVRAFHPLISRHPFDLISRDHRKLLVTDGTRAMLGGLCIGDEWAGDPVRQRRPWRDTMVAVCGPAAGALDLAFGRIWRRAGEPLPAEQPAADPEPCGDSTARVLEGVPGRARVYRAVGLLLATATERLWITDAYLVPPAPLYASLLDAARGGVDVRLLVPGSSDLPVLRDFTRVGYRALLRAGVRVFEYQGPMIHAKTMLVDRRWARIGSSNMNVSSLLTNYELDLVAECETLTGELAAQFRRDLASSREIVLQPRRVPLPPKLVGTAAADGAQGSSADPHKRSGYELGAMAVVALRRVAGGLRHGIALTAALTLAGLGTLLLAFPRIMGIVLAAGAFTLALAFGLYAFERRRTRDTDDG